MSSFLDSVSGNLSDHDDNEGEGAGIFYIDIVAIVLIILSDVLIIACNLFMLFVLQHQESYELGEVDLFLFRVMAVIDILGGLASTLFQIYTEPSFASGRYEPSGKFCLCLVFFCFHFANLSGWLQCMITANKFLFVVRPLRYSRIVNVKRVAILLSICILFSLNCGTFLPIPSFPYTESSSVLCREGIFHEPSMSADLIILVAFIACPAVVTSVLNVSLLIIAVKHTRKVHVQETSSMCDASATLYIQIKQRRTRGIKTIGFLVITSYFYVTFTMIYIVTHPLLVTDVEHSLVSNLLYLMSLSSFWWKLFVFLLTDARFRNVARKAWSELKKECRCWEE